MSITSKAKNKNQNNLIYGAIIAIGLCCTCLTGALGLNYLFPEISTPTQAISSPIPLETVIALTFSAANLQTSIANPSPTPAPTLEVIPTAEAPLTIEEITFLSKRLVARLQSKDYTTTRNILLGIISQVFIDRTPKDAFGIINIYAPKDNPPNEDPSFGGGQGIITASTPLHPVGAPLYKRSIPFEFTIQTKRPHK